MRNGTLRIDDVMKVVDALGVPAVELIAASREGEHVRFGQFTFGHIEALLIKLLPNTPPDEREELARALLDDEKKVAAITIEEVIRLLIDQNGRGIPDKSVVKSNVCDANRGYYFDRLATNHDFAATLALWQERFGQSPGMDAMEFCNRIMAIEAAIQANPQIKNLVGPKAAPWFPIILPGIPLQPVEGIDQPQQEDYGHLLERLLLPAVEASYTHAYPDRKFINHRKDELEGQVTIVEPRHAKLYADLANGPIVGILFPAALQGFSPFAQREWITLMPENCSLEGPLDMSVGETLYAKELSRDGSTPLKDGSAVQWRDPGCSLCFGAGDGELGFDCRGNLGTADGSCSGGVVVRG